MTQVEYITIKNASRKVLNKMRKIGQEKAQRLQKVQILSIPFPIPIRIACHLKSIGAGCLMECFSVM